MNQIVLPEYPYTYSKSLFLTINYLNKLQLQQQQQQTSNNNNCNYYYNIHDDILFNGKMKIKRKRLLLRFLRKVILRVLLINFKG